MAAWMVCLDSSRPALLGLSLTILTEPSSTAWGREACNLGSEDETLITTQLA